MKLQAALPFSEHQLQVAVCHYMDLTLRPPLTYIAIPNGGARHIAVARKLKAEGVRAGVADLEILMDGGRVAWLELKIRGGRLSPDQRAFRDAMQRLGHPWALAKTLDEAIAFLGAIGALKTGKTKC